MPDGHMTLYGDAGMESIFMEMDRNVCQTTWKIAIGLIYTMPDASLIYLMKFV